MKIVLTTTQVMVPTKSVRRGGVSAEAMRDQAISSWSGAASGWSLKRCTVHEKQEPAKPCQAKNSLNP